MATASLPDTVYKHREFEATGQRSVNERTEDDTHIRNEAIRLVVRRNYKTIVGSVLDISTIMDWFIQENVFSIENKQRILASPIPQDCCRGMLDTLLTSTHSTAFIIFLKALNEHCDWIVKRINQDVDVLIKDSNFLASLTLNLSWIPHLKLENDVYEFSNIKKDEELKMCQKRLEVIKKLADDESAWEVLGSYERVKELEEKLRRAREKEKRLTAQLEYFRRLTINQFALIRQYNSNYSIPRSIDYSPNFDASGAMSQEPVTNSAFQDTIELHDTVSSGELSRKSIKDLEIHPDEIQMLKKIFFTPHLEIWKGKFKNSGKEVVVKTLTTEENEEDKGIFLNEAETLVRLQHPNVLQILGVNTTSHPYCIIIESLHHDDLLTVLQLDKGRNITTQIIIKFSRQIADAMNYLEKNKYVHRRLSALAILLTDEHQMCKRDAKISQFRLSAYVGKTDGIFQDNETSSVSSMGSHTAIRRKWTAPEALKTKRWTIKCDVWSYGVLLYEMLTYGEPPCLANNDKDMKIGELITLLESGSRLSCPKAKDQVMQKAYDIIYNKVMLRCWNIIAENRPSFSNLFDFFETFNIEKPDANSARSDFLTMKF